MISLPSSNEYLMKGWKMTITDENKIKMKDTPNFQTSNPTSAPKMEKLRKKTNS